MRYMPSSAIACSIMHPDERHYHFMCKSRMCNHMPQQYLKVMCDSHVSAASYDVISLETGPPPSGQLNVGVRKEEGLSPGYDVI